MLEIPKKMLKVIENGRNSYENGRNSPRSATRPRLDLDDVDDATGSKSAERVRLDPRGLGGARADLAADVRGHLAAAGGEVRQVVGEPGKCIENDGK